MISSPVPVTSGDQHVQLTRLARAHKAPARLVLRARIVLAAAAGAATAAIARELHVTVDTVRKWRARFAAPAWTA